MGAISSRAAANHKVRYMTMQKHYTTLITVVCIPRFHPSYKYFVRKLKAPSERFIFMALDRIVMAGGQY